MTRAGARRGVDARAAVELLDGIRSIVDVIVYVWEPQNERWRMLSFGETQALWERRGSTGARYGSITFRGSGLSSRGAWL